MLLLMYYDPAFVIVAVGVVVVVVIVVVVVLVLVLVFIYELRNNHEIESNYKMCHDIESSQAPHRHQQDRSTYTRYCTTKYTFSSTN